MHILSIAYKGGEYTSLEDLLAFSALITAVNEIPTDSGAGPFTHGLGTPFRRPDVGDTLRYTGDCGWLSMMIERSRMTEGS